MFKSYKLVSAFIMVLLAASLLAPESIEARGTISPELREIMDNASPDEMIPAIAVLKDRVDIAAIVAALDAANATLKERHRVVVETLQERARETQPALLSTMENLKNDGTISEYKSMWVVNMVFLTGNVDAINAVNDREEIDYIFWDAPAPLDGPVRREPAPEVSPNGHEIGLEVINAHLLWAQGVEGEGVLVSNIDTGVNGNHPALNWKWHGTDPGIPWSEAWLDLSGGTQFPTDGDGHGSHTMGTMNGLAQATNDTIGVAPKAHWIAVRTNWSTSGHISGFQWLMDPDGNPTTNDDVPAAVNNSWWDPNVGLCAQTYWATWDAVEAAGCAVIYSAGNSGPGAQTITRPKNRITTVVNVWATGALDGNNPSLPIASFSSRGPSACDSQTIKPEASAPGVSVRSSVTGSGYSFYSGTSMAAPHVAGAIALLRDIAPNAPVPVLKEALYYTARDLGAAGEDNAYGMGVIDVYAAAGMLGGAARLAPSKSWGTPGSVENPIRVKLMSTTPVTEVTFSVVDEPDVFDISGAVLASHISGFTASFVDAGDTANIEITSTSGDTIPAGDTLLVTLLADVPVGGISGVFADVLLVNVVALDTANDELWASGGSSVFTVGQKMDIDGDGSIDITDVITIINHILGRSGDPTPYQFWAMDANDDGLVNIYDIIKVINHILGRMAKLSSVEYSARVALEDVVVRPDESISIPVHAFVSGEAAGLQLEAKYDESALLDLTPHRTDRTAGMEMVYSTDQGKLTVLLFSTDGNVIAAGDGDLLVINARTAEGIAGVNVDLSEVNISDVNGNAIYTDILPGGAVEITTMPLSYNVRGNYPNPFNPFTKITFDLPEESVVKITVLNVLGEVVKTLVDGEMSAGSHSVEWNGRVTGGVQVSSGVYLYRVTAVDASGQLKLDKTKKMLLLK